MAADATSGNIFAGSATARVSENPDKVSFKKD
jgi:hypothetical protein